jgi:pimeloyl-ACP methyl ester carboxylesterase
MRFLLALSTLLLATSPAHAGEADCSKADDPARIKGNDICFVIRTWADKVASPAPGLVVFLHGDTSSGGPSSYLYPYAATFADKNTVVVALIRPGYYDEARDQSGGSDLGRNDNYTPENVDAVAAAVTALRERHKASRVVLFGHSGGAATSAIILGRKLGTADAAVLLGCPCDLRAWRAGLGRRDWQRSLSPIEFEEKIPAEARVVAAVGASDSNTFPKLSEDYVKRLGDRGIKARYLPIPDAGHGFDKTVRDYEPLRAAIREALSVSQ